MKKEFYEYNLNEIEGDGSSNSKTIISEVKIFKGQAFVLNGKVYEVTKLEDDKISAVNLSKHCIKVREVIE